MGVLHSQHLLRYQCKETMGDREGYSPRARPVIQNQCCHQCRVMTRGFPSLSNHPLKQTSHKKLDKVGTATLKQRKHLGEGGREGGRGRQRGSEGGAPLINQLRSLLLNFVACCQDFLRYFLIKPPSLERFSRYSALSQATPCTCSRWSWRKWMGTK